MVRARGRLLAPDRPVPAPPLRRDAGQDPHHAAERVAHAPLPGARGRRASSCGRGQAGADLVWAGAHHLREANPQRLRTRGRVAGAPAASDEAGPAPRAGCAGRATGRQSVPEGLRGAPRVTARTYASPESFKQALEQRLRSAAANGPDFARRRQLLVFERFLARVVAVLGDAATLQGGVVLALP